MRIKTIFGIIALFEVNKMNCELCGTIAYDGEQFKLVEDCKTGCTGRACGECIEGLIDDGIEHHICKG